MATLAWLLAAEKLTETGLKVVGGLVQLWTDKRKYCCTLVFISITYTHTAKRWA